MENIFIIDPNSFLSKITKGYFHQYYTGFQQPNNPDFINLLKNTFNNESKTELEKARNTVANILVKDLRNIVIKESMYPCTVICIPRAKALSSYSQNQLKFKEAVQMATNYLRLIDGTNYITRYKNTKTTHLRNSSLPNDGENPYPGITKDTCRIDKYKIKNNNIILIDDIYTKTVNIDEDCIQALYDNQAKKVIFYSIGYTRRNQ